MRFGGEFDIFGIGVKERVVVVWLVFIFCLFGCVFGIFGLWDILFLVLYFFWMGEEDEDFFVFGLYYVFCFEVMFLFDELFCFMFYYLVFLMYGFIE